MLTLNLTIYCGTLFSQTLIWSENNAVVDLTDWKAKAQIKSASAVYSLSTDNGQIALGTTGEIALTLSESVTATMSPGSYSWDILLMNPQGDVLPPLVAGVVTVLQGVTVW